MVRISLSTIKLKDPTLIQWGVPKLSNKKKIVIELFHNNTVISFTIGLFFGTPCINKHSIGGRTGEEALPSNQAWTLELESGVWEKLPDMNSPHAGADCIEKDDKLWVVGGQNVATVEFFDIKSKTWTLGPSFPGHHDDEMFHGHLFTDANETLCYFNNQIRKVLRLDENNGWSPFSWYDPVSYTRRHWMSNPRFDRTMLYDVLN